MTAETLETGAGGETLRPLFLQEGNMTVRSMGKQLLSLSLVAALLISACPAAFAAEQILSLIHI